jgi:hypothetical protein
MSCPFVETSAGEPLISKRPFAVAKWSAWLVSKESPFSEAPCPVILKSTISYPTLLLSSPYRRHTKNTLFPILWEDETNVQECLHMVKWEVQQVASEPPQAPGYYMGDPGVDGRII